MPQDEKVCDYVTYERTGTVHLTPMHHRRTLCGIPLRSHYRKDSWTFGDETLSGIAATCKHCKSIFRIRNWRES